MFILNFVFSILALFFSVQSDMGIFWNQKLFFFHFIVTNQT